jgi:transposase
MSMRKTKEVLRMTWSLGLSQRQVARSLSIGLGTVGGYLRRARLAGLSSWEAVEALGEEELESRLFAAPRPGRGCPEPAWAEVRQELCKKGVTLSLLWQEYKREHPEGYQYSRFCELYGLWKGRQEHPLRQEYKAGERLFVDFSGLRVPIYEPGGEQVAYEAEIFVACLGASDLIYGCAVRSQQLVDWVECHRRSFEFCGGSPQIVVPDNLKSGVTRPCRYDPEVNRTYWDLARHYGVAVIPARPGKPQDKAKVEQAVQMVQRWVLAPLRHERFTHVGQLNAAMKPLLAALNDRPMRVLGVSRRALFERVERGQLRPLPDAPYELAEWRGSKVGPDYHVEVERHYYSVPYTLVGRRLEVRLTARVVEVFLRDRRVGSHARSFAAGRHTTLDEHMPPAHRAYLEWTPERIRRWVGRCGPEAQQLAEQILASRDHPQQGFRACLGLIRLGKSYGGERLEAACRRARASGATSYSSVASILKSGLDRQHLEPPAEGPVVEHDNVRGADYYRQQSPPC